MTFTAGAVSTSQSTVVASPTSVTADGSTPSTITVTLNDANNNPVSGKTVTLAKTRSGDAQHQRRFGTQFINRRGDIHRDIHDRRGGCLSGRRRDGFQSAYHPDTNGHLHRQRGFGDAIDGDGIARVSDSGRFHHFNDYRHPEQYEQQSGFGQDGDAGENLGSGDAHHQRRFRAQFDNGVVTFTVKSTTAGADVFTATDTTDSVTITPTGTVTFTAGAASQLVFTTQPSASTVAGVAFAQQPVVTIENQYGNTVTSGADSTVSVALTLTTGTVLLAGRLR